MERQNAYRQLATKPVLSVVENVALLKFAVQQLADEEGDLDGRRRGRGRLAFQIMSTSQNLPHRHTSHG